MRNGIIQIDDINTEGIRDLFFLLFLFYVLFFPFFSVESVFIQYILVVDA